VAGTVKRILAAPHQEKRIGGAARSETAGSVKVSSMTRAAQAGGQSFTACLEIGMHNKSLQLSP